MGSLSLLQGIFPDPGIKPRSLALQADSFHLSHQGSLITTNKGAILSGCHSLRHQPDSRACGTHFLRSTRNTWGAWFARVQRPSRSPVWGIPQIVIGETTFFRKENTETSWKAYVLVSDRPVLYSNEDIWVCVLSHLVMSNSMQPYVPARLHCPWDSSGKNTGVGCHVLLRGSSWSRDGTHVSYISCIGRQALYHCCHLGNPKIFTEHLFCASGSAIVHGNTTASKAKNSSSHRAYLIAGTQTIKEEIKLMKSFLFESCEGSKAGDLVFRWDRGTSLNTAVDWSLSFIARTDGQNGSSGVLEAESGTLSFRDVTQWRNKRKNGVCNRGQQTGLRAKPSLFPA